MSTNFDTNFMDNNNDPILANHVAQYAQPINNLETGAAWFRADTGAADAHVVDFSDPDENGLNAGALTDGQIVHFKASATNTGTVTLTLNGVSSSTVTLPIKKSGNTDLTAGDIQAGQIVAVIYNSNSGGRFEMATGTVGPQGPAGPAGADGAQGPQGNAGPAGAAGADGAPGAQGATGPQGPPGEQGLQGPIGPEGPPGLQGPEGTTGAQGPAGSQGATGSQGPPGEQGLQGPIGPEGPPGLQGPEGPSGAQGPAGTPGATGPQGPTGSQGATGPQGPPGSSATIAMYQVLNRTFTTTISGTSWQGLGSIAFTLSGTRNVIMNANTSIGPLVANPSRKGYWRLRFTQGATNYYFPSSTGQRIATPYQGEDRAGYGLNWYRQLTSGTWTAAVEWNADFNHTYYSLDASCTLLISG